MGFIDRGDHLGPGLVDCGFERRHPQFELEHPLHTGEIETLVGQFLDLLQKPDVGLAVATAAATGSGRFEQALALVDPQRLRMHAGQFRRHRDDVDGPALGRSRLVGVGHDQTPRYPREAAGMAAPRVSTASRCSSVSSVGTST